MTIRRISDLPAAATFSPDDIQMVIDAPHDGQLRRARLRDAFSDEDAALLHLVSDYLERRQMHPPHVARMRRLADTITKLLMFDPPPINRNQP